jgi:uncharacterized protein (TIGR00297 family)
MLATLVAGAGYRRGALDRSGALAATVLGAAVYGLGGPLWGALLVVFFVTSSTLSLVGRHEKRRRAAGVVAKGERRDVWQVLANGSVGGVLAVVAAGEPGALWPFTAFVGATAAAAADTWATEIGLLTAARPRLITTLRLARPGESGAVSLPGTLAAAAASLLIGLAALGGSRLATSLQTATVPAPGLVVMAGLAGGLAGALLDSLLGATLQAVYLCPACGLPTELPVHPCGSVTVLRRGLPWLSNDGVNLLATAGGAGVGALLGLVCNPPTYP